MFSLVPCSCLLITCLDLITGEDTLLNEQPYHYLTVDEMKSLGDDSLPIDVTQDDRHDSNRDLGTELLLLMFTLFLALCSIANFLKLF